MMATKRQLEIRAWCLSNLEADEKILWYGETALFRMQQWHLQLGRSLFSLIPLARLWGAIGLLVLAYFVITLVVTLALSLISQRGFGMLLGVFYLIPLFAVVRVCYAIVCILRQEHVFELKINPAKVDEPFQNIACIITTERILVFENGSLREYTFELLDDIVLSKPKDGLSNISLYSNILPKSKNPYPSYVLRAIPEEEAQTAYLILREARDYAERVRERDMALGLEKRRTE